MKVGVAKETAPGERRVALVPEALGKLTAAGLEILVEAGAGAGAAIPDPAYADAGATIVSHRRRCTRRRDVVLACPEAVRPTRSQAAQRARPSSACSSRCSTRR